MANRFRAPVIGTETEFVWLQFKLLCVDSSLFDMALMALFHSVSSYLLNLCLIQLQQLKPFVTVKLTAA